MRAGAIRKFAKRCESMTRDVAEIRRLRRPSQLSLRRWPESRLVLERETVGGQIALIRRGWRTIPAWRRWHPARNSPTVCLHRRSALGVELGWCGGTAGPWRAVHTVITDRGEHRAPAVIVATGVKHRRLGVPVKTRWPAFPTVRSATELFTKGRLWPLVGRQHGPAERGAAGGALPGSTP